jgi:hypothetical protein
MLYHYVPFFPFPLIHSNFHTIYPYFSRLYITPHSTFHIPHSMSSLVAWSIAEPKLIGCNNFGPRVPKILSQAHLWMWSEWKFQETWKLCPFATMEDKSAFHIIFSSCCPLDSKFWVCSDIPRSSQFSHWLKFCSSQPLASNVKQALFKAKYKKLKMLLSVRDLIQY